VCWGAKKEAKQKNVLVAKKKYWVCEQQRPREKMCV